MIKLNFNVFSFYYLDNNFKKNYNQYHILQKCDDDMLFSDVLKLVYDKYKIDNGNFENYYVPHLNELMWGQFFSKKIYCDISDNYNEFLKSRVCDLDRQFGISKLFIPFWLNYDGIGKSIGKKEGIKFFFHFNEKDLHHKPHIHCKYSDIETRIDIITLDVLDKPFKKSKMNIAIDYVKKNQEELLNYWNTTIINGQYVELNIEK